MKLNSYLTLLALCIVTISCGNDERKNPENQNSELTQEKSSSQNGMYEIASIKGHEEWLQGSISKRTSIGQAFPSGKGALVKLSSNKGLLTVEGGSTCQPKLGTGGTPSTLDNSRNFQLVNGFVGTFKIFTSLVQLFKCNPSEVKINKIFFAEKKNLFGLKVSLPANLGVLGEPKNAKASDEECKTLENYKYYQDTSGVNFCLGRTKDGGLKILLVRAGEIYTQRLILRKSEADFKK